MEAVSPSRDSYLSELDADHPSYPLQIVSVSEIVPFRRSESAELDFGGFDRKRMMSLLSGIASDSVIKPVKLKSYTADNSVYRYQLYDGAHRYHASIAAGFKLIPGIVCQWGFEC
ncbi:MAG: hypothetical protein GC166_05990 [Alphaproteobacteria bacterium]|nr:hypothetical protein [Alphaproteobacteria bacterium]